MKNKIMLFVLDFILIFALILAIIPQSYAITEDIDYTFENDILINTTNPSVNSTFNIKDTTYTFTQNYSGSYSWDDQPVGTSDDDIFYVDKGSFPSGTTWEIISEWDNHDTVLNMEDTSGTNSMDVQHWTDTPTPSGTFEFWFYTTDATGIMNHYTYEQQEGINTGYNIRVYNDYLMWIDSGGGSNNIIALSDDTWYHIRIDFECTSGGYLGLSEDHFFITVNGERFGEYEFRSTTPDTLEEFRFWSGNNVVSYNIYLDGLGENWLSNYTIGNNYAPLTEANYFNEVDKFEFAFEGISDFYDVGDDNPEGWTDKETGGGDEVNIANDGAFDREVRCYGTANGDIRGLEKDDFDITGDKFNITLDWDLSANYDPTGYFQIHIYASDSSELVEVRFYNSGVVSYDDGSSHQTLTTLGSPIGNYLCNFYISHNDRICIFEFYETDTSTNYRYMLPLLNEGKTGLKEIEAWLYCFSTPTGLGYEVVLDSIGVYDNGTSQSEGMGWLRYNLNGDWDFRKNNLFTINAEGYFGITANYTPDSFDMISYFYNYSGVDRFMNLYNLYDLEITEAFLYCTLINTEYMANFTLDSLYIYGVKLTEGSNEYFPSFTSGYIDGNESYFYVDSYHSLRFSLTCDDDELEYMQLAFNINDIYTENSSISFDSNLIGSSYGYIRLSYLDATSSIIELPKYAGSTSVLLPQDKTLDIIYILISDEDLFNSGTTIGYIRGISLIHIRDIEITITTLSAISMMLPLILMIFPSFVIGAMFEKGKRHYVIIPLFLLLAILCYIGELIPSWLLAIILITMGMLILINRNVIKTL